MINPDRRAMKQSLAILVLVAANLAACPARAEEYNLSKGDVSFLQDLAKQDEFIRRLGESDKALDPLSQIFAGATQGPTKLVLQWNQALIRGWRRANNVLDFRNKGKICDAITEFTSNTKNAPFFFQLYEARGCED
jgi:hypothetical protein